MAGIDVRAELNKKWAERAEKDPTVLTFMTPDRILQLIDFLLERQRLEVVRLQWSLVNVGSYKVKRGPNSDATLLVTKHGIVVSLPHAKTVNELRRLCIPTTQISDLKFYFGNSTPLMALKTGVSYANWLRKFLGMDQEPKSEVTPELTSSSNCFYCPLLGLTTQKWITISVKEFTESDVSGLRNMFPGKDQNKDFTFSEIENSQLPKYVSNLFN